MSRFQFRYWQLLGFVIIASLVLWLGIVVFFQKEQPNPLEKILALGNFHGWEVCQKPDNRGPYFFLGSHQSHLGGGVSGSFGSHRYSFSGKPGYSLLVTGLENVNGDIFVIVHERHEKSSVMPTP